MDLEVQGHSGEIIWKRDKKREENVKGKEEREKKEVESKEESRK